MHMCIYYALYMYAYNYNIHINIFKGSNSFFFGCHILKNVVLFFYRKQYENTVV